MNHKKYLLEKLKEAITGKINYNEFEENFYNYYITKVSDDELSEKDHNHFTKIQEKFEYTAPDDPKKDRQHGYISYDEFKNWLREYYPKTNN